MDFHRLPDWDDRLVAFLDSVRARPYHAVDYNCAAFVLGVIEATTGVQPGQVMGHFGIEAMPASITGVARFIAEHGGMSGAAEKLFGVPADPAILCARRGDLVLFDGIDGDAIGVMEVGRVLCLTAEGLWPAEQGKLRGFWRLG